MMNKSDFIFREANSLFADIFFVLLDTNNFTFRLQKYVLFFKFTIQVLNKIVLPSRMHSFIIRNAKLDLDFKQYKYRFL